MLYSFANIDNQGQYLHYKLSRLISSESTCMYFNFHCTLLVLFQLPVSSKQKLSLKVLSAAKSAAAYLKGKTMCLSCVA